MKTAAKSAAERQKAYRERRAKEVGEQRINAWVNARAIKALNSLALRYGVTQKVMLERLILNADDGLIVQKPQPVKSATLAKKKSKPDVTQLPTSALAVAAQTTLWDEPIIESDKKPKR